MSLHRVCCCDNPTTCCDFWACSPTVFTASFSYFFEGRRSSAAGQTIVDESIGWTLTGQFTRRGDACANYFYDCAELTLTFARTYQYVMYGSQAQCTTGALAACDWVCECPTDGENCASYNSCAVDPCTWKQYATETLSFTGTFNGTAATGVCEECASFPSGKVARITCVTDCGGVVRPKLEVCPASTTCDGFAYPGHRLVDHTLTYDSTYGVCFTGSPVPAPVADQICYRVLPRFSILGTVDAEGCLSQASFDDALWACDYNTDISNEVSTLFNCTTTVTCSPLDSSTSTKSSVPVDISCTCYDEIFPTYVFYCGPITECLERYECDSSFGWSFTTP